MKVFTMRPFCRSCLYACALVLLLAFTPLLGAKEASERPPKVLFIGNSFTMGTGDRETVAGGGVPGIVANLAEAAGLPAPLLEMSARGGFSLGQHLQDGNRIETALHSEDWDYVVLQEFSTLPTDPGDPVRGGIDEFMASLVELKSMIDELVPGAEILLFQTWAREQEHRYYQGADARYPGGVEAMSAMLSENYAAGANRIGARVVPVGEAWETSRIRLPELYLHSRDGYHAGSRGSYLTGLVFFVEIYAHDPRGLPSLNGVPELQARQLQDLVWTWFKDRQAHSAIAAERIESPQ